MIDKVHVIHPRGAGRHATEAGEAAINMFDHFLSCIAAILKHVLDQIDAPARRIELIAKKRIGGTRGRTEAAMDTGAKDLSGLRDIRIVQLRFGKMGLHRGFNILRACGQD